MRLTEITLELDDLTSETREMIKKDIEKKISQHDKNDFEAAKYDIINRKLEAYDNKSE